MKRASISHHVEDLEGKINQLLVPLSTTQMITNHFKLNQENNDMERASISHHVKDLEGKINQVLVALSTTHMITKHYKPNRENTDMERASISHHVEDLEGKIKQLLVPLSITQEIIKNYKLGLENAATDIEVPSIKRIHDQKLMHTQTLEIVRMMISKVNWNYKEASVRLKKPVLTAARLGIHEFVDEVLKAYPNSAFFCDEKRHNIFLLAVSYRKEKVFNLIHDQMASVRDYITKFEDGEGGNILHLAAKFVPSSQIPGSALQMQRELQWFKSVRDLMPQYFEEELNKADETPEEVFTREHKDLLEKGEKWMRDTATSCSVVAALIITIIFAAAFTVPGGVDSNGIPNYLNETYFKIFAISTAIALFSSTTWVQMFLGMLTSRYAEEDFLASLPRKLVIGQMTLFLSNSSMMVAFGAAFCIVLYHPWKWVITLICLLGCIPTIFFAWMQFPILVAIFRSAYGPNILNPMKR